MRSSSLRRALRATGLVLFLSSVPFVLGFGICGPSDSPPPAPRGCDSPATAAEITLLEVGAADGAFAPSARATQMFGGQGLEMVGYRIGVRATGPVSCITASGRNLAVAANVDDWFVTDAIWTVGSSSVSVDVEAYGMRVMRVMSADEMSGDAGSIEDAGPMLDTGTAPDTGTP